MSETIIVTGSDCLDYIDKPVGFGARSNHQIRLNEPSDYIRLENYRAYKRQTLTGIYVKNNGIHLTTYLWKWAHNVNKRVVGYVKKKCDDGGLQVYILGNESFDNTNGGNVETLILDGTYNAQFFLSEELPPETPPNYSGNITDFPQFPDVSTGTPSGVDNYSICSYTQYDKYNPSGALVPFDNMLDFVPEFPTSDDVYNTINASDGIFNQGGSDIPSNTIITLTDELNTTLEFGCKPFIPLDFDIQPPKLYKDFVDNPLYGCFGNVYNFFVNLANDYRTLLGGSHTLQYWSLDMYGAGRICESMNGVAIPYNIILTENEQFAREYLDNGTLPPDAFLYPLDWDNLPRYDEPVPTGDEPDDYPDDNTPDDDVRDFDQTPNEIVSYTVNQLTNYNWYWLTVPQWSDFISWFWNDIGNYSDFDDIIAKVKGLYNDIASAVIMCRYYPVDYEWITQKPLSQAPTGNIKLGMIEKSGAVQLIDQEYSLRSVDIGHVHIGQKYKSFMDMSPYSQLSLYLPWHGFIDLDMNLFNGHDVYVKALYDYLSGTIQYYVFYDNEVLVNTILCKMAMDIPITLQTKNDRDSAIFNNVSSTIGGLVGAGAGILSGNPIGMALGVTQGVGAFNSANASAPMRLMGNVGESGAYIGCQNCFVVVRRPTIQASDGKKNNTEVDTSIDRLTTWKKNVGMLCGYGYKLSSLSGKGFTVCHSPRINFTNTAPLQSEVDEIYSYLEKGVIL